MKLYVPYIEINESPDLMNIASLGYMHFYDDDAYPFGYAGGQLLLGRANRRHESLRIPGRLGKELSRYDLSSPGRMWANVETMSFWTLDDDLEQLLEDLNDAAEYMKYKWRVDRYWKIEVFKKSTAKASLVSRLNAPGFAMAISEYLLWQEKPKDKAEFDRDYTVNWDEAYKLMSR